MLTEEAAKLIALATIISRLDYCNRVLWDLLDSELNRLQKIQNSAAILALKKQIVFHQS